jgi:hypothetical protein
MTFDLQVEQCQLTQCLRSIVNLSTQEDFAAQFEHVANDEIGIMAIKIWLILMFCKISSLTHCDHMSK